MKLLSLAPLLPLVTACLGHSGSGRVVTEHRNVGRFDALEISGAPTIELALGDEPTAVVEIDDNLQRYVRVESEGGTLVVRTTENVRPSTFKVRLTTPALRRIELSGAADLSGTGLRGDTLELEVSGAAEVALEGEVGRFDVDTSGAAEVQAHRLIAEEVHVDASGAAEVEVHARRALEADLSGAVTLGYAGQPEKVETKTAGACEIVRR